MTGREETASGHTNVQTTDLYEDIFSGAGSEKAKSEKRRCAECGAFVDPGLLWFVELELEDRVFTQKTGAKMFSPSPFWCGTRIEQACFQLNTDYTRIPIR